MYFRFFVIISPLEKGRVIHFNKFKFPSPKNDLCQVWLKLALWFLRRWWKCKKFMTTTMTTTNNGQILIRIAHPRLRWAKNHKNYVLLKFDTQFLNFNLAKISAYMVISVQHTRGHFSALILLSVNKKPHDTKYRYRWSIQQNTHKI